ncbi:MAG: hypothetical protein NTY19_33955 [Planctomycetota bacterium]|nr:hypothetical protein [Planctomycetota bacterium]
MSKNLNPLIILVSWWMFPGPAVAEEPVDIGSRLEPLVDRCLIDKLQGDAELRLHKPTPQEVVLVADKPWEGNTSAYFTILQDGARYRMYYRGSHWDEQTRRATHREVTCYAESQDGIHWIKPKLGLFEFDGSQQNNIVWDGLGTHNFTPFLDANPACPAEAKYKALAVGERPHKHGLYAFQSPDGIHWKLMQAEPVVTQGAFDSQNLAFWDAFRGLYIDYQRGFREGVRDIMLATSQDFLHWTEPMFLTYPGAPKEHLYTNAIRPYDRAPHILFGFPTRFLANREEQVEPTFMTSRDGRTFQRWTEALIPLTAPQDREGNRSNYMAWGLVRLPGEEQEYSVYGTEAYYRGPASRLRRFTYRVDGFVSVHAGDKGGELVTKPLRFQGNRLVLNYATTADGALRVEIQDPAGKALDGFRLTDCPPLRGDVMEHAVTWAGGSDVSRWAGKPVRLRFELRQADLFSLRFQAP